MNYVLLGLPGITATDPCASSSRARTKRSAAIPSWKPRRRAAVISLTSCSASGPPAPSRAATYPAMRSSMYRANPFPVLASVVSKRGSSVTPREQEPVAPYR